MKNKHYDPIYQWITSVQEWLHCPVCSNPNTNAPPTLVKHLQFIQWTPSKKILFIFEHRVLHWLVNLRFLQINEKTTECPPFFWAAGSYTQGHTMASQYNTLVQLAAVLSYFLFCCICSKLLFPSKTALSNQEWGVRTKSQTVNPVAQSQSQRVNNRASRNSPKHSCVIGFEIQNVWFHTMLCRVSESWYW